MPSTYYNYEVSPITVVYKVKENSFIHFLVQVFFFSFIKNKL